MDNVTRREAVAVAAGIAGMTVLVGSAGAAGTVKAEQGDEKRALQEGSEFILKLNGIKLPAEAEKRIAAELQSTMLRELGKTDLKGGMAFSIPRRWWGIWFDPRPQTDIPDLGVKEIGR